MIPAVRDPIMPDDRQVDLIRFAFTVCPSYKPDIIA